MMLDLGLIKKRLDAAHAEISRLCRGGRWQMCIPAQPEYDSDLIIVAVLRDTHALIAEVRRLRYALYCYTSATDVQSFGYEELRDNGEVAREALGFGDHAPQCKWPNDSERCTCGLEDRIRAEFDPAAID